MLEKIYARNTNVIVRAINNEYVIVPLHTNLNKAETLYTINPTGVFIWNNLDGKLSLLDIRNLLTKEYEVTENEANTDLIAFIEAIEDILILIN